MNNGSDNNERGACSLISHFLSLVFLLFVLPFSSPFSQFAEIGLLTHQRWHLALRQFGHGSSDGYLKRRYVECCHIILTASLIIVVNDIFSHVIIWSGILNVRFTTSTVHDKDEDQYWIEEREKFY
jgi:hypothetical protein